jgi:hypothetical protein
MAKTLWAELGKTERGRVLLAAIVGTIGFGVGAEGVQAIGRPFVGGLLSVLGWLLLGRYLGALRTAAAALGAWTAFVSAYVGWVWASAHRSPPFFGPYTYDYSPDPVYQSASLFLWPFVGGISAFAFSAMRKTLGAIVLSIGLSFAAAALAVCSQPIPSGMF